MSSVKRLEIEKVGAPIVALTMVLTFATVAFFLVARDPPPPVGTAPPAGPPYEAAVDQVPSERVAPYQGPNVPGAGPISASEEPQPATSPPPQPGAHRDAEDASPGASEQRVFKARRALETVDARELLRQVNMPK